MLAQQGVRKVLDVKFHPEGLPQLVSCSNEVSTFHDYWCILYLIFSNSEGAGNKHAAESACSVATIRPL